MATYDDYHAIGRSPLSKTQKATLRALLDHCGRDGDGFETYECYPSIGRMERYSGFNRRSIERAIKELEQLEVLYRRLQRGRSTFYRLKLNNLPPCVEHGTVVEYELQAAVMDENGDFSILGPVEKREAVFRDDWPWAHCPKLHEALFGRGKRPVGAWPGETVSVVVEPRDAAFWNADLDSHHDPETGEVIYYDKKDEETAKHGWRHQTVRLTVKVISVRKATQPEINTRKVSAKRSPRPKKPKKATTREEAMRASLTEFKEWRVKSDEKKAQKKASKKPAK